MFDTFVASVNGQGTQDTVQVTARRFDEFADNMHVRMSSEGMEIETWIGGEDDDRRKEWRFLTWEEILA